MVETKQKFKELKLVLDEFKEYVREDNKESLSKRYTLFKRKTVKDRISLIKIILLGNVNNFEQVKKIFNLFDFPFDENFEIYPDFYENALKIYIKYNLFEGAVEDKIRYSDDMIREEIFRRQNSDNGNYIISNYEYVLKALVTKFYYEKYLHEPEDSAESFLFELYKYVDTKYDMPSFNISRKIFLDYAKHNEFNEYYFELVDELKEYEKDTGKSFDVNMFCRFLIIFFADTYYNRNVKFPGVVNSIKRSYIYKLFGNCLFQESQLYEKELIDYFTYIYQKEGSDISAHDHFKKMKVYLYKTYQIVFQVVNGPRYAIAYLNFYKEEFEEHLDLMYENIINSIERKEGK